MPRQRFSFISKKSAFPLLLLFVVCCCIFFTECRHTSKAPKSVTGFYYDTIISVTIYDSSSDQILSQCMDLANHYEKLLSPNIEGSDIWNINHNPNSYVTVSEDTLSLISTALSYARLSDGLVDPTVGSLSQLWNFGSDNAAVIPDQNEIKTALSHINYESVHIKENQVMLSDPSACMELGFIAKGFIADKIKEFLLSKGVTSAIINLGGNVLTVGSKPDGTPFSIGIQKPFEKNGVPALTLSINDASVVSSGSYERYFKQDNILYHHILSTQTGYPVDSGLSQVTIISTSSVTGDALSTLCFILGYEKAVSLLESYPDVQAVFIAEDGQISYINFDQSTLLSQH